MNPAGKNPLYGIVVYVPSAALQPLGIGASCTTCQDLYTGNPVTYAVTDAAGHFTLEGVPDGQNVPLVIQVGKWRMQYTVPTVLPCQENAAPSSLHLPRSQAEGDIPTIAIATGGADTLECLLGRVGLNPSEYGGGATGTGRIHIYQGDSGATTSPAAPVAAESLWDSVDHLMAFDMVLLSCEGHETTSMNQQALYDYAQAGGRVFASHFHYSSFEPGAVRGLPSCVVDHGDAGHRRHSR